MLTFCTVGDYDYLLKGLAMYQSLKETVKDEHFILNWLCIDSKTYKTLIELTREKEYFDSLVLYSLAALEYGHPELKQAKENPPSNYGTQYSQYCWCLAPWFTNFILKKLHEGDYLMYIDSDIFFYQSPKVILDAMQGKSVGIHTHRFSGRKEDHQGDNGWYNVGVVVFKKDETGRLASSSWKEWLLTTNHRYYEEYGTCGDQKYLELFPKLLGGYVSIFDQEGDILHYAPWCTHNPNNQTPAFFHFSHFTYDISAGTWSDSIKGEWNPSQQPGMKEYYQNYFLAIRLSYQLVHNAAAN